MKFEIDNKSITIIKWSNDNPKAKSSLEEALSQGKIKYKINEDHSIKIGDETAIIPKKGDYFFIDENKVSLFSTQELKNAINDLIDENDIASGNQNFQD